jgi:peptidoglycan/xylan/chitin deacetylase (PgdA/CDA1 family)
MIHRPFPRAITALLGLMLLLASASSVLAAGPAVEVSNGPRTVKEIALTFDDGSSPDNCRRILAELVTAGVPATFFPIARAMQLDPAFWRLVAQVGDPIGDHTLTHPQMPTLGYAEQVHQMQASRTIIERIIGRPMLNVFRPPYGAWDATTLRAAAATGFPTVLNWDTSDRDTSPQGTLAHMLAAADHGTNGSVILMHCGPNATPYLVPSIIDHYRALGYRFVTVPKLLGIAWDPGKVAEVTPATILGSLAPLPVVPKGGPIVGGAGWTGPIPTPTPRPSANPSPTPTSSVLPATSSPVAATPSALPAPPSPPAPQPTSSPAAPSSVTPRPTVAASAEALLVSSAPAPSSGGSVQGAPTSGGAPPIVIAGTVILVLTVAIVLRGVVVAARRKRSHDGGGSNG